MGDTCIAPDSINKCGLGRQGMTMKKMFLIALTCATLGCATANYTTGRDFSTATISKIEKGKTTADELVVLMGQPFTKVVASANEEKWTYTYINSSSSAQSYIVPTKVETTGIQKVLDVLVRDGVVINFAYTENPLGGLKV